MEKTQIGYYPSTKEKIERMRRDLWFLTPEEQDKIIFSSSFVEVTDQQLKETRVPSYDYIF